MLCVLYLMTSTCGSKSKDEQRTHKSGMEHKGRILPSKFTVTGVSQYRKCREKKLKIGLIPDLAAALVELIHYKRI